MNILLAVGLAIFFGTLAAKVFRQFKIPQVVSYIVVGLLLGDSFFHVWTQKMIEDFSPFINLALGIIGFLIGSELKIDLFRNRGRSIYSILLSEGLTTFFVVSLAVWLITQKLYLALFLGAVSAATDPATTADVLWENKARGPLTTTLLAIVALDDALALMIYGFGSTFAKSLITKESLSILHAIEEPFFEIGSALLLGALGGYLLFKILHFIKDKERFLPFSLGIIVLFVGIAASFKIDLILVSMAIGMTLINIAPVEGEEIINAVKRWSPPIYLLFFVLVGARLNIRLLFEGGVGVLAILFFISRTTGKMSGAFLGALIGRAQPSVTKNIGFGLFAQGGVAIGLAMSIYQNLSHMGPVASQVGLTVLNVAVATIFMLQVVAPFFVRFAAQRANEIGRDVTEEDVIASFKVSDLMDEDIPIIREDMPAYSIIELAKETDAYHFCVVDREDRLLGIISLGDLREMFLSQELGLNKLVLARDVYVPVTQFVEASRPLSEAMDIFKRREIDFLPVVEDRQTKKLVGAMDYRTVMAKIHKEYVQRRGNI